MEQITIIYIIAAIVIVGLALGLGLGLGLKKDDDNGNNNNNNDNKITYTYYGDKNYKNFMNIEDIEGKMYENSSEYKEELDQFIAITGEDIIPVVLPTINAYKNNLGKPDLYIAFTMESETENASIYLLYTNDFFIDQLPISILIDRNIKCYSKFNYKKNGEWVNDPNFVFENLLNEQDKTLVKNKIEEIENDPSSIFYKVLFQINSLSGLFEQEYEAGSNLTFTTSNMPVSFIDTTGDKITYHMLAIKD